MVKIVCLQNTYGCIHHECVYINGKIHTEGNPVNEGYERVLWFIKLAKAYGVNIEDIKFGYICDDYLEYGEFPNDISYFKNIEWYN